MTATQAGLVALLFGAVAAGPAPPPTTALPPSGGTADFHADHGAAAESPPNPDSVAEAALAATVEIVRTEYGVPHVTARDFRGVGFALGWLQSEDYGDVTARSLVKARGEYARWVGRDSIDGDFVAREAYARAVETYGLLEQDTRDVYEGFAAGLRYFMRLHPEDFPAWIRPDFTGVDVHAGEVQSWSRSDARRFVRWMESRDDPAPGFRDAAPLEAPNGLPGAFGGGLEVPNGLAAAFGGDLELDGYLRDGSNAWAFHPSRTTSGRAILLRNPHLRWNAGYYEAHIRIPGVLDFYGDFRIGGAFWIIGGFNPRLGWATTNNYPRYSQVYALERNPESPDHYMLDGRSHPVTSRTVSVDYRSPDGGVATESRTTFHTPYGPVIHEDDAFFYVLKDPRDGEYRRGEQFLKMMQAQSLDEWLQVMRMRAHPSSNFTYADADGNIVHLYNARLPRLPHALTGDSAAVARRSADIWQELVPFDDLPLYINPPGGYVQQANDTPDYTNLNVVLDRDTMPANLPEPRLRPRSQLSLDLVHGGHTVSLEDVVRMKHTPRMFVAEQLAAEVVTAVRHARDQGELPTGEAGRLLQAADILEAWDGTAAAGARGAVLFKEWFFSYRASVDSTEVYAEPWTAEKPMDTPRGLGRPDAAVTALARALDALERRGWSPDVPWGEIHRVVRGDVDEPVAGCEATLGCFRVLSFEELPDGRRAANRGDGWVFAVEFGDVPRGYSVLAYGESAREDSPHFDDQAALFARGHMKPIRWTPADIDAHAVVRYRPGEAPGGGPER